MKRLFCILIAITALIFAPMSRAQDSAATPAATPAPKLRFFLKLVPPRPTFANNMTPDEAKLMQEHADYWKAQFAKGGVLIIGPVLESEGCVRHGGARDRDRGGSAYARDERSLSQGGAQQS